MLPRYKSAICFCLFQVVMICSNFFRKIRKGTRKGKKTSFYREEKVWPFGDIVITPVCVDF